MNSLFIREARQHAPSNTTFRFAVVWLPPPASWPPCSSWLFALVTTAMPGVVSTMFSIFSVLFDRWGLGTRSTCFSRRVVEWMQPIRYNTQIKIPPRWEKDGKERMTVRLEPATTTWWGVRPGEAGSMVSRGQLNVKSPRGSRPVGMRHCWW